MAGNTVRVGTQVTGVGKSSSDLDKLRDKFEKLQKQGAKGIGIGIGVGAGTAALNLLGNAAGMAGDFLGDLVKSGMEEEASISRLGASLKANIPNWDGNTAAIEATMAAQVKLGFSDDEQRDSLSLLVAATKDTTKALQIQRTAMDLARFKRISLAEATDALTKVEAGSYRILKSLGITLKDNATQTDALAAVQAVAEGQAADYAQTVEGKLLVAQTKFGEKMDELGTKALPLVEKGVDALSLAIDGLGLAIEGVTALTPDLISTTQELAEAEMDVTGELSDATVALLMNQTALDHSAIAAHTYAERLDAIGEPIATTTEKTDEFKDSLEHAKKSWDELNDRLKAHNEFEDLPDKIIVAADDVRTAQEELNTALEKGNKVAIAAARLRLRSAQRDLQDLRDAWATLRAEMAKPVKVGGTYHPGGTNAERRHSGGPVTANTPYIIGKPGAEELFVPGRSGVVVPPGVSGGRPMVGGVGDVHVHIGSFYGTQQNIADLSRQIGQQVRLATVKGAA